MRNFAKHQELCFLYMDTWHLGDLPLVSFFPFTQDSKMTANGISNHRQRFFSRISNSVKIYAKPPTF